MLMPTLFRDNFVEDLFDDFFGTPARRLAPVGGGRNVVMNADVQEFDDHYEIDLQLPGYKKEDINAELKDGYLTVTASHNENKEEKKEGRYLRRECYYGQMQRSFYVGDQVEYEDIHAGFENGILKLSVAKKEKKPEVETRKFISID